jgi:predicted DNA-binding ribbon-helix-helix protein
MGAWSPASTVLKRSIVRAGHKTSVSLEDEFWNELREIAKQRGRTVSNLIAAIDDHRQHTNLSSAVRLFVLGFYQEQFSDQQGRTREQGPLKPDDASAPLADAR